MGKKHKGPTPKKKKGHSSNGQRPNNAVVVSKAEMDELMTQNTAFSLGLAALVYKYGELELDGRYSYVLRLPDFQTIAGSDIHIENGIWDDEAGTKVFIKLNPESKGEVIGEEKTST